MLQSMTGYGKFSCNVGNKKITAELKSLNSKQLDLSTRISSQFREKEMDIRNTIAKKLIRGKVDMSLYVETTEKEPSASINSSVVEDYFSQMKKICDDLHTEMPKDWLQSALRLPDVLSQESVTLTDEEWNAAQKAIDGALEQLVAFRTQEGVSLVNVFNEKIKNIGTLLLQIDKYENERIDMIKSKLREGLESISDKVDYDKNRFEQEMIFYIEKLDVHEEKNRLRHHLDYFIETLNNEPAPGKKLGFIAQEIGREINTLGSKSNHSEMQKIVVKMKDELEQIKEQVFNAL
jgi:uncharacterized protein (TIGR00255 family)